jgi:predicted Zn-dependent peptidase
MNHDGYFRRELPGGARLVGQHVPGRRSAALGVWLRVGSRDEEPGREGLAHFIEHLVFKGTHNRTGQEIATGLERMGGSLEAFTTKDTTCFYARVLEEQTELAIDVLGDLISHPRFASDDVEIERKVVIEELRTVQDTPEELIGDLAQFYLWPDDIMGASILGTQRSLERFDAPGVNSFHGREYRAPRLVVSAAGAVDADRLEALCRRHLDLSMDPPEDRRRTPKPVHSTLAIYPNDLGQLHIVLVTDAPSEGERRRRPLQLMTEIFGGGMSSRLFQAIRERDGLAYSVQAYTEHFDDAGMFGISLAVSPERGEEALSRTLDEMKLLRREGLKSGELSGAKAQVRGSLIMGLESLTNRMTHLARTEYRTGGFESVEETIEEFEAVTEDQVMEAAAEALDPDRYNLVALGPTTRQEMDFKGFTRVVEAGVN